MAASSSLRKSCFPACFHGMRNIVLAWSSQIRPGYFPLLTCRVHKHLSYKPDISLSPGPAIFKPNARSFHLKYVPVLPSRTAVGAWTEFLKACLNDQNSVFSIRYTDLFVTMFSKDNKFRLIKLDKH